MSIFIYLSITSLHILLLREFIIKFSFILKNQNMSQARRFEQNKLLSTQNIIKNYQLLSSQDAEERENANRFLMSLADHEETWITCQNMIQQSQDPNFSFLGAQLFYQKIQKDLHQFDSNFKIQLKNFLFGELDSERHKKLFVIDKLASSAALISCSLFLNEWTTFMQDLTEFMKKSSNHLLSGLIILQRIPEELKMTNRIAQGIKSKIQTNFLQKEELFSIIFDSVFDLKDETCTQRSLKAMQSWVKICFPLMKYPLLTTKVLQNSLENVQKLQQGIKVICQALKLASEQKLTGLSEIDPSKQQQNYSQKQIQSLKIVIQFVIEHKKNFLSYIKVEPEYAQMYLQLVQQLPLSFGFLILEDIGFQLLAIILELTSSYDLKLSYSTFEFWMDYSEKIGKMKLELREDVKQKILNIFISLLELFSRKLLIQNENLMFEADLKDDQTVDDADGMTFTEYRKQSGSVLKYIYDFFVKLKKEQGAQIYFKKVCQLLQNDDPPLNRYTQLALFVLKSPLQSMIHSYETVHIVSILQYLITKINNHNIIKHSIPPIVLGESMNFIRDCTRQIKQKDKLFLQSLKFVLNYINDQKLCHHAAYCFQILMETINTLNDPLIAQNLIQFYSQKKFTKQVVLEKILQGIFNAIIKVPDKIKVEAYLDAILTTLFKKYLECSKTISIDSQSRSELYLSLVEIKTVLDSYDSSHSQFKVLYKSKFLILANKGIEIVNEVLPLGIKNKLRFSSINEVGLSISIYRVCLKILQIPENFQIISNGAPGYIKAIQIPLLILNQKDIIQYYYTITIISQTLVQFINHSNAYLDHWLINNLSLFSNFFIHYYQNNQKIDPDVIKIFFNVHESLLLYNRNIFQQFQAKQLILKMALHSLRHLNQKNMQRKVVSFLFLSLQNQVYAANNFQSILQNIFASIPIIHSMCHTNLAKIFKYLLKGTNLQSKQKILLNYLNNAPYGQIEQSIKNLLAKCLSFAVQSEQQRHIKSIFIQLTQIIWKKISSDILMQLQLKLATWKRQHKKKKLEESQHNQQNAMK